jgi:hypothetical protein
MFKEYSIDQSGTVLALPVAENCKENVAMLRQFRALWLAAPVAFACSGSTTDSTMTKQQAAQSDLGDRDVCAEMSWYGDGECDTFCTDDDTDCIHAPGEVGPVCAAFSEAPNGVCGRAADDVCRMQDPDCAGTTPPPDDGVVCALYIEESDGVCSRPDNDPCRSQDPDCTGGDGVACLLYIEESDGVCSRPADDPCKSQDPDCVDGGVACDTFLEEPNGICGRDPNDPCIFQDPDCDDGVVCALYIEEPDGVCSRADDDPCRSQDPDCK